MVTERLAANMERPSTYMNALTSTTPSAAKTPMVMPTDKMAIAAAITMCAGIDPARVRLVRIKNTLHLRQLWVSEALLPAVEKNEDLRVVEEARPMSFDEHGALS